MPNNKVRREGDVVYISLNGGYEAVVDESDYWKVAGYGWCAGRRERSKNGDGYYVQANSDGSTIYLHRLVMDAPRGTYVDHVDFDPFNNRRSNLRLITNEQNNAHRNGAYGTSKTGIRGVSFHQDFNRDGTKRNGYYIFRCHIKTCKACRYFQHSPEGLELARKFSEEHYEAARAALPS